MAYPKTKFEDRYVKVYGYVPFKFSHIVQKEIDKIVDKYRDDRAFKKLNVYKKQTT